MSSVLKRLSRIMEHPTVYQWWQAPFVKPKLKPILQHNDLGAVRRVLDVG